MQIIPGLQILVSIFLVIVILLQHSSAGLGGAFGGESIHHTRRGSDRFLFISAIGLSAAFLLLALLNLIVR